MAPAQKIHRKYPFFALTFSFQVYIRCWRKKIAKKFSQGGPRGVYFLQAALFWIFKNHIFALRPLKMTSDKKVMKAKSLPFDEIYLERGLRFKLRPQIGALEPKNAFLAFSPICWIHSCLRQFQVLQGFIFEGKQIKNPLKPVPKNIFGHNKLKKVPQKCKFGHLNRL